MKRISFVMLLVAFSTFFAAVPVFAQSISELDGEWKVTTGTLNGQTVSTGSLDKMSLNITGGTFAATSGDLTSGGNVTLAPEGTFQLNFAITSGADAGKSVKALYRLENGVLTISYSQNDQFPSSHSSTSANKYCTLLYRKGVAGASTASKGIEIQDFGGKNGAANAVAD